MDGLRYRAEAYSAGGPYAQTSKQRGKKDGRARGGGRRVMKDSGSEW